MRKSTLAILIIVFLFTGVSAGAESVWDNPMPNIYWGDLHVHTNLSWDAYGFDMAPGMLTEEAGLYATYCSKVDFWAYTDHAEGLTDRNAWQMTIDSAQRFNKLGRANPDSNGDPKVVAFMGFEWTHSVPWGHKNIIFKYDDLARITPGPIPCSRQIISKNMNWSMVARSISPGKKQAIDPAKLYKRLDAECLKNGSGCEATVIPHGNAWGNGNFMTDWNIQNNPAMLRPDLQRNIEVYSKHGNSEEYRYFPPDYIYYKNGIEVNKDLCKKGDCKKICSAPTKDYEPCCWRAGKIVASRCVNPDSEFCRRQISLAREGMAVFPKKLRKDEIELLKPEFRDNPSAYQPGEWQTCGNCRTCYQPAWNYVTDGSVQKALATYGEDENGNPAWFRFGFLGSTDTHQGRPASVKEVKYFSEKDQGEKTSFALENSRKLFDALGFEFTPAAERHANFFNPGGLVAIQAKRRTNVDLYDSLVARHVYGTSGSRIEAWLRAEVFDSKKRVITMGEEVVSNKNPVFHIRANGAFREDETCPYDEEPDIKANFSREDFLKICYNQCYRVLDERVSIDRVEVVKILQPLTQKEADMKNLRRGPRNPDGLIMDPYHVHRFDGAPTQIEWEWTDGAFEKEVSGRSVVYYFRIIQSPTEGYQCSPAASLGKETFCNPRNPTSWESESRANPQDGTARTPLNKIEDACYTDTQDPATYCQERAWTSPVYITRE